MNKFRDVNRDTLEWEDIEVQEPYGIYNVAWHQPYPNPKRQAHWEHAGYNDMLRGDKVMYNEIEYTIVMVSRMGDFGLSETGYLPYSIRVCPKEVVKFQS